MRAGEVTGVSILNKRAGRSTKKLYELEPGDVVSCLGPLGVPFKPVAAPVRGVDGRRRRRPRAVCDAGRITRGREDTDDVVLWRAHR